MAPSDNDSISIESAISYAERMRNSYRAFEKLRQVLLLCATAEQRERDANMAAKKLEQGNAALVAKHDALEKAVDGLDAAYHAEVKKSQTAHGERLAGFDQEVRQAQHDLAGKLAAMQAELDAAQQAKQASIDALEVEERRLRDLTVATRQELQRLKSGIPDS